MRMLLVCVAVVGCVSTSSGRKVSQAQLDKIVIGTTTWMDAEKSLGQPVNFMESFNSPEIGWFSPSCGEEKAPIHVAQYSFMDGDGNHSTTDVLIDQRGVVCYIRRGSGNVKAATL